MEFEPTIRVFECEKTIHALDHAATVIGVFGYCTLMFCSYLQEITYLIHYKEQSANDMHENKIYLCDGDTNKPHTHSICKKYGVIGLTFKSGNAHSQPVTAAARSKA
jgi:hypothetical protein